MALFLNLTNIRKVKDAHQIFHIVIIFIVAASKETLKRRAFHDSGHFDLMLLDVIS